MADNSLTLTAAELRAISERLAAIEARQNFGTFPAPRILGNAEIKQCFKDRARLFAELERLIDRHLYGDFATQQIKDKDAAIDALLQGGGE